MRGQRSDAQWPSGAEKKRLMFSSGSGYPELAERKVERLDVDLGGVEIRRFSDGEVYARYLDSIRNSDVSIMQPLANPPTVSS